MSIRTASMTLALIGLATASAATQQSSTAAGMASAFEARSDIPIYSEERSVQLAGERAAAAALLSAALEHGGDAAELAAAAGSAAAKLPRHPALRAQLQAVASAGDDTASLDRAIEQILDDLRFQPTIEANLPAGFPATGPVDELVVKAYPSYRMARTTRSSRGGMGTPFFALFNHIQRNDIAMTAPVQMDDPDASGRGSKQGSMAFLYSDPALGSTGADPRDARVEVIDVAPTLTISVGARGYESPERIGELRARLESWLRAHTDIVSADGPLRTMGYNSPMVAAAKRFFEVEVPIRLVETAREPMPLLGPGTGR